jgi:hypothetical protein
VETFSMLLLIPLLSGAFGILMFPYPTSQVWWSQVGNLILHNSFGLEEIPSFIVKTVMKIAVYVYTAQSEDDEKLSDILLFPITAMYVSLHINTITQYVVRKSAICSHTKLQFPHWNGSLNIAIKSKAKWKLINTQFHSAVSLSFHSLQKLH